MLKKDCGNAASDYSWPLNLLALALTGMGNNPMVGATVAVAVAVAESLKK